MRSAYKPHVEKKSVCADCRQRYCAQCEDRCPKCYGIHIKREDRMYA